MPQPNSFRVRSFIRYFALSLSALIVFIALIGGGFFWRWHSCADSPLLVGNDAVIFDLSYGTSVKGLSQQLKEQGLIKNTSCVIWLARLKKITHKLQAGTYRITPHTTLNQLLYQMSHGQVILHRFTIVDGWTFDDLMRAMNRDSYLKHTLDNKTDQQIMQMIDETTQNPEGQFLPDTYLFAAGVSDVIILKKAHRALQSILQTAWTTRSPDLPYKNSNEALILASLVEKETGILQEKPQVAGVLVRRLQQGMRLQVDPTVIYGLGESYNGTLTKKDLLTNTPYNTYLHKGLPPTPIAMPDEPSIYAVMHPTNDTTLYYVASGNGGHFFSTTLSQHNLAVARYRWTEKDKKQLQTILQRLAFPSCRVGIEVCVSFVHDTIHLEAAKKVLHRMRKNELQKHHGTGGKVHINAVIPAKAGIQKNK